MTRQHGHVVAERKKFFANSVEQKIAISARQIPATDAAGKKDITADEQIVLARKETKTSRTMPRHLEHLKFCSEKIAGRCFFDKEIRFGWLHFQFETEVPKKLPVRNHRLRRGMTTNRAFKVIFDFGDVLDVIDVAVGQQQHLKIDLSRLDPIAGALRRIKENPAVGRGNEIAVRFENAAAERFISHLIDS